MAGCCGRFVCVVALRPPMEMNLGSEGRVHVHLAGMAVEFSGGLRGDRETQRERRRGLEKIRGL